MVPQGINYQKYIFNVFQSRRVFLHSSLGNYRVQIFVPQVAALFLVVLCIM